MISPRDNPAGRGSAESVYKDILENPEQPSGPAGRQVYQQGLYKPSYAPQPVPQQPVPQQPFPDYRPMPVVVPDNSSNEQEQEHPGSWKPWAGGVAGLSAGMYIGFDIAKRLGESLLITIPTKDHPDPNWLLLGAPIAGGIIGAILFGIAGAAIGYSAYKDYRLKERHR